MFVGTGTIRKPGEYREARRLRREAGMPIKQIAARLGVSPSTVHGWTRDIKLTAAQRRRNWPGQPPWVLTEGRRRQARKLRQQYQKEGRLKAREGDPLHLAGCMLYWAEGTKDRNQFSLANSDIHMVRFMRRFVSEIFGRPPEDFTVSLNVYTNNGLSILEIENRWLAALDLPRSCLRTHTLNNLPTSSSGRKRFKLPLGVCDLRVHRGTRLVQHIFGAIQEYGGFEEPGWLDGPPRKRPSR
jgi:hypothetical protein